MPPPTTKKPPARPEPAPEPPVPLELYAESGDVVLWFPGADAGQVGQPAVATKAGPDTSLTVNVMHPDVANTVPMDGVLHMDHPRARFEHQASAGGWRHRPITLAVRRMLLELKLIAWDPKAKAYVPTPPGGDLPREEPAKPAA